MYWNTLCDLFIRIPKFSSKNYMIFRAAHWRLEIPQQHFFCKCSQQPRWNDLFSGSRKTIMYIHFPMFLSSPFHHPHTRSVFSFVLSLLWFHLCSLSLSLSRHLCVFHTFPVQNSKTKKKKNKKMDRIPCTRWNFCSDRFSTLIWFQNWLGLFPLSFMYHYWTACDGQNFLRLIDGTRERNWRWWGKHHRKAAHAQAHTQI